MPRRNYNQMYKEENDVRDKNEMKEGKLYEESVEAEPVEEKKPVKKPKNKKGTVVGGNLNIRNNPGGDVIGNLSNGEEIEILEDMGEWYKISNGFVMSKFVEVK